MRTSKDNQIDWVSITARRCSDRSVDLEAVMISSSRVCACWIVCSSCSRMVRFQAVNHHLRERQDSVGAPRRSGTATTMTGKAGVGALEVEEIKEQRRHHLARRISRHELVSSLLDADYRKGLCLAASGQKRQHLEQFTDLLKDVDMLSGDDSC